MSTEPTVPPQPAGWGAPPPAAEPGAEPGAKKGWNGRKTAIAVGVAVLIAAGGGVAIAMGTSGGTTTAQQPGMGGAGGRQFGGTQGGAAGGETSALRNALHGDFVVADGKGGYATERLQTGDVTAISATSISLTSKDGYAQVYTIDATTQKTSEPKTGESVTVVAKVSGDTATATSVGSATALQGRAGGTGQPPNGQMPSGGQRPGGGVRPTP
ncbi:MAG: hypothetical protein QOI21_5173 [Actinomycetota bacterium]|jgi:hypothetical protein|nr:hypothetical protein [Actinomycetota bacterium]